MLSLEDFYQDESADISEVYEYFEDPSIANAHSCSRHFALSRRTPS